MNWLKRLFGKKEARTKSVARIDMPRLPRITLAEWQANLEGITAYRELSNNASFKDMLAVLQTVRPRAGRAGRTADRDLGYIEGYEACMTTIWLLSQYPPNNQPTIEADFGAEEVQKNWK